MIKIVFLDEATVGSDISLDSIKQLGEYKSYPNTDPARTIERIAGYDVIITNKVHIGKDEIDSSNQLKLICEAATGTNNIDVEYAKSKNIPVKNVAGYSTESVVQVTFMHLLNLAGKAQYFDNSVKSGNYSKSGSFTDVSRVFFELDGKKIGIIGMGTIGRRVADVATSFGMKVSYYSTSGTGHCTDFPCYEIDRLLKENDVISIHAPMNERTNNLVTYEKLCMMKKSAFIINMGRGGIINEADLVKALNENKIAGAATDVFSKEPLPADHPYMKLEDKSKMLFSPHIGWASREARERLVATISENIKSIL